MIGYNIKAVIISKSDHFVKLTVVQILSLYNSILDCYFCLFSYKVDFLYPNMVPPTKTREPMQLGRSYHVGYIYYESDLYLLNGAYGLF